MIDGQIVQSGKFNELLGLKFCSPCSCSDSSMGSKFNLTCAARSIVVVFLGLDAGLHWQNEASSVTDRLRGHHSSRSRRTYFTKLTNGLAFGCVTVFDITVDLLPATAPSSPPISVSRFPSLRSMLVEIFFLIFCVKRIFFLFLPLVSLSNLGFFPLNMVRFYN